MALASLLSEVSGAEIDYTRPGSTSRHIRLVSWQDLPRSSGQGPVAEPVVTQWFTAVSVQRDLAMLHSVLFSESLSRGDPRLVPVSFDNRELLLGKEPCA